jgi:hypothetical protein
MTLLEKAFIALYPHIDVSNYTFKIKYSRKFSAYNANVKYFSGAKTYAFNLSYLWRGVSSDIVIGLIQYLMIKALRLKPVTKNTMNIELYNSFLKNVHKYQEKKSVDPELSVIFNRLNEKYFNGMLDGCNLVWGQRSVRTLGHYAYGSDTITMSSIFRGLSPSDQEYSMLEYVLYHEMLHKKHKFSSKGGRHLHHSRAFRLDEAKFENAAQLEKDLDVFVSKARFKRFFGL